jgi:hypothetical protein
MGLRDVVIPRATITIPNGGSFAVRALSPNDALQLYYRHAGQLSYLFEIFAKKAAADGTGNITPDQIVVAGSGLIAETPSIMAEVISIAAGEDPGNTAEFDDAVKVVLQFPAGVQMEALGKIAELTFTSDMPPGKFLSLVLLMARSATASLKDQNSI